MHKTILASAVLAATLAAHPVLAQNPDQFREPSRGYTYFHKAGATIADHDTRLNECAVDARMVSQPPDPTGALMVFGGGLGGCSPAPR